MFARFPRNGLFVAVALLLGAVAFANRTPEGSAGDGPVIGGPTPEAKSGWEYKALPRSEIVRMAPGHRGEYILPKDLLGDFNRGLDVLGEQGWELAAVEPYHKEGYVSWPAIYVFRRPK